MFSLFDIVIEIICAFLLVVWLLLFMMGSKYKDLITPLNEKEFPFKEIYGVGFAAMDIIKYKYKSKSDKKLKDDIEILYGGKKYVDYYIRVIYAQRVTLAFTLFLLGFILYGLAGGEILMVVVMTLFSGLAYYYFGTTAKQKITKRSNELLSEFANVVSKLALLTNAGMIMHDAWRQVAESGDGVIYEEMRNAVTDMDNGISESEALRQFGIRCVIPEIKKFTSVVAQGLSKGNAELAMELQNQSKEVWMLKKQDVKRQGELAANKLMIPIVVMFIGILIMVIVPVFANLGI